jgi:isochorismate hydrolase
VFERVKDLVTGPKIRRPDSFRNKAVLVIDLQHGCMQDMRLTQGQSVSFESIKRLLGWARKEAIELVFLEDRRDNRAGITIPAIIEAVEREKVIEKWTPDGFENGKLLKRLNEKEVGDLIICGYAREVCVFETGKNAGRFGFRVESSPDLIFGSKSARPSIFREAVVEDFYKREVAMHASVDELIEKNKKPGK